MSIPHLSVKIENGWKYKYQTGIAVPLHLAVREFIFATKSQRQIVHNVMSSEICVIVPRQITHSSAITTSTTEPQSPRLHITVNGSDKDFEKNIENISIEINNTKFPITNYLDEAIKLLFQVWIINFLTDRRETDKGETDRREAYWCTQKYNIKYKF